MTGDFFRMNSHRIGLVAVEISLAPAFAGLTV
jgi:hypothetical protein